MTSSVKNWQIKVITPSWMLKPKAR